MKLRLVPILAIASVLIFVPAAPASAHTAQLSVSASCAGDGWQVAWTIQNTDGHKGDVTGTVSFVNGVTDQFAQIVQGQTLPGNGVLSGAPSLPGSATQATVVMRVTWTEGRNVTTTLRGSAVRPSCVPNGPPPPPPASPSPSAPTPSPSAEPSPTPAPTPTPEPSPAVIAAGPSRTSVAINPSLRPMDTAKPVADGSMDLLGVGVMALGIGLVLVGLAFVGVVVVWEIKRRRRSVASP